MVPREVIVREADENLGLWDAREVSGHLEERWEKPAHVGRGGKDKEDGGVSGRS